MFLTLQLMLDALREKASRPGNAPPFICSIHDVPLALFTSIVGVLVFLAEPLIHWPLCPDNAMADRSSGSYTRGL